MKVVVAPNAFKGSLGVLDVCRAMTAGVSDHDAIAEAIFCPMSDGGDGLCDVMRYLQERLEFRSCEVLDPLGRRRVADYLWDESSQLAVIESAKANGISLVEPRDRDVLSATSFGVGQLVAHALDAGAREIVIGAGGSASVDGGLGCLQALGARVQTNGCEATLLPGAFSRLRHVDLTYARARVREATLTILCDVDVSLAQGWKIFAPQKGASTSDMRALESGLKAVRDALAVDRDAYWNGVRGGAAGGLTAALALLGASLHNGAEWVANRVGLLANLQGADLVLTGEGKFDATSLVGKAPGFVLDAAREVALPVAVVAGHVERDELLNHAYPNVALCGLTDLTDLKSALREPEKWIREATRRLLSKVDCEHTKG